jgi:hypothetical protein
MGSAGAKMAAVALGDAEVYVHAGGQYESDWAPPAPGRWSPRRNVIELVQEGPTVELVKLPG